MLSDTMNVVDRCEQVKNAALLLYKNEFISKRKLRSILDNQHKVLKQNHIFISDGFYLDRDQKQKEDLKLLKKLQLLRQKELKEFHKQYVEHLEKMTKENVIGSTLR